MRRWLKVAAPAVIAVVALAVLTGGFRDWSDAGATDCNQGMDTSGRLASGKSASFNTTFCSDPTHNFAAYVTWGHFDPNKDLALHVTDPNGNEFWVDNDPNAGEAFFAYAPLAEGTWTVEVVNQGSRSVNYDLLFGFG